MVQMLMRERTVSATAGIAAITGSASSAPAIISRLHWHPVAAQRKHVFLLAWHER